MDEKMLLTLFTGKGNALQILKKIIERGSVRLCVKQIYCCNISWTTCYSNLQQKSSAYIPRGIIQPFTILYVL